MRPLPDPQRKAGIRESLLWTLISYVSLLAGIAWAFFAANHWAGSRGVFLAVRGVMVGVAASSALFFPVLKLRAPNRRLMGMSISRYTQVTVVLAAAIAAVLIVAALAIPQK